MFEMENVRAILWRQRYVLMGVIGLALVAGLVLTMLTTPTYRASATVRIDTSTSTIVEGQDLSDPYINPSQVPTFLATLTRVIESRDMALRVVDSLNLDENEAFLSELATTPRPDGVSEEMFEEQRRQAAAGILLEGLETQVLDITQIIEIGYYSPDPMLAAKIANGYAENFLIDDINQSLEANSYAREFLEGEIADIRAELRDAEMRAIAYARANQIIAQPIASPAEDSSSASGTSPTLTASNLMQVNEAYTDARARRIQAEQRWRAIAGTPAVQIAAVRDNGEIQSLRARLSERRGRLADLRERYQDDYPEVQEVSSEIEAIQEEIASTSAQIKNSIRDEFQIAARQENALRSELAQVSDASLDEQDRRVQYNIIDREVQALRSQLENLMERNNQISSAANLRSNDYTLLDRARPSDAPASPNLFKNLFIALVLGSALAVALAVLRELLDDRLRSVDDVERRMGLTALGQTPYVHRGVEGEITNSFSPISEAYASIRATLDYVFSSSGKKIIQFTSSQAAEGKSTSSAAIATKYAEIGRKVLLIDMDLRRPALHSLFGKSRQEKGIVEVLFGRVELSEVLIDVGVDNLHFVPVGEVPGDPIGILSSGLIPEFLKKVRPHYDLIIIDGSPVLGIADAPLLTRFVEGVVFIVEANQAKSRGVRTAVRRLNDVDANLVGAVVTKFRALDAGQSYSYQYSYYAYDSKS
ncbi:GumC family protein [Erythrobacter alti]|uniref:GumC family protein n=1 Tax=Erythrobacter alti TaxID=1896145 RepID=UPI0030F46CFD